MVYQQRRVLVAEAERALQALMCRELEAQGFRALRAADGLEALALWEQEDVDFVVLALRLPHVDGIELCRRIRQSSTVPIIMLAESGDAIDKVNGLMLGADDYLTTPCNMEEFVARVGAILRRVEWHERQPQPGVYRHDRLELDFQHHRLLRDGRKSASRQRNGRWCANWCSTPGTC